MPERKDWEKEFEKRAAAEKASGSGEGHREKRELGLRWG